jgi:hypothetical protein
MPQGVYVLMTSDGYRATVLNDYDSLFDGYADDMSMFINKEKLKDAFDGCVVLNSTNYLEVARALAAPYKEMPDGIRVLTTYRNYSFEELKNGKASKN